MHRWASGPPYGRVIHTSKASYFRKCVNARPDPASMLGNQPEASDGEVVIEGERQSDAGAFHDGEARCIHRREFVQVVAAEIFPALFEIAQFAGEDLHGPGFVDGALPRQGDVPIGIALEKGERLDDYRDRGM